MIVKPTALRYFAMMLALVFTCSTLMAQTKVFTYQGSLTDGTTAANGTYQMQFRLFASETGGKPLQVINDDAVTVANGVFKVNLNFTVEKAFDGNAARYLEIAVKKASEADYNVLPARQLIKNSPYSIKTLRAGFSEGGAASIYNTAPEDVVNTWVLTGRSPAAVTYTIGQAIAGRTITVNKFRGETLLKITYIETFEKPANTNGINAQLFITVDGQPPYSNPGIISAIAFPIGGPGVAFGQANTVGYVTGLPLGNHTIGVVVASNSVMTFPHYQYVLEVQEVFARNFLFP